MHECVSLWCACEQTVKIFTNHILFVKRLRVQIYTSHRKKALQSIHFTGRNLTTTLINILQIRCTGPYKEKASIQANTNRRTKAHLN